MARQPHCIICEKSKQGDTRYGDGPWVKTYNGLWLCRSCAGTLYSEYRLETCTHCNKWRLLAKPNLAHRAHEYICLDCKSLYKNCMICDRSFIKNRDDYADNIPDAYTFCDRCITNSINGYNHLQENLSPEKVYYGVELEVEFSSVSHINIKACILRYELMQAKIWDKIQIKSDGSLDHGFELVTTPLEFSEYSRIIPVLSGLLTRIGARSHDTNTCGLHIHRSKCDLSLQDIAKLCLIYYSLNNGFRTSICRRTFNNYCYDKRFTSYSDLTDSDSRYEAINLGNPYTVEFRQFKGTTLDSTILASLQFVNLLVSIAKLYTLEYWSKLINKDDLSIERLIASKIDKSNFSELKAYFSTRNTINLD